MLSGSSNRGRGEHFVFLAMVWGSGLTKFGSHFTKNTGLWWVGGVLLFILLFSFWICFALFLTGYPLCCSCCFVLDLVCNRTHIIFLDRILPSHIFLSLCFSYVRIDTTPLFLTSIIILLYYLSFTTQPRLFRSLRRRMFLTRTNHHYISDAQMSISLFWSAVLSALLTVYYLIRFPKEGR